MAVSLGLVLAFGSLQLACGIALVVLDILCLTGTGYCAVYSIFAGMGWISLFQVVSGSMGVAATRPLRVPVHAASWIRHMIATFVMAVLSCMLAAYLVFTYGFEVVVGRADGNPDSSFVTAGGRGLGAGANLCLSILLLVFTLGHSVAAGLTVCKLVPRGDAMIQFSTIGGDDVPYTTLTINGAESETNIPFKSLYNVDFVPPLVNEKP